MQAKNNYNWHKDVKKTVIGLISFASFTYTVAHAHERPVLSLNPRYMENYEFLSDRTKKTDFFDPIKYISLGKNPHTYLSLGGEIRERYEAFTKNPLFGLSHLKSDDYLLHRSLIHADLHITRFFRTFVQLGYHRVQGKKGAILSTERNGPNFQQAFAETTMPIGKEKKLVLRVGRQEILLGSQRLVSVREGPNIRQSFDALCATYKQNAHKITGFVARPVAINGRAFHNPSDNTQGFWGIYTKTPFTKKLAADLYYLGLNRDGAKFGKGTANEKRHSVGARLFGSASSFDYNVEALYQFGKFGPGNIRAWTIASDVGYILKNIPWQPRIGMKADIASGDKNKGNKNLNTFNALFPRGSYFTENALIGPANFIDLQPNITLNPRSNIMVNFGCDILWRQNTQDAIYRQPNLAIANTAGRGGKYTGTQSFILMTWQMNQHLSITATYVHFTVDRAIKSIGGGDNDYVGSWITYRF